MSWLEKLLPPKIQQTDPADRRSVPEGLWVKCPSCETVLYNNDLEQNQNVCPSCGHHHRITARGDAVVVATAGAHVLVLLQIVVVQNGFATGALHPQAFGHAAPICGVGLLNFGGQQFFQPTHVSLLGPGAMCGLCRGMG